MVQYSPRSFFRQASNALLAEYFSSRELPLDLDRFALKSETDTDPVYQAWNQLSEADRTLADADFRDVQALADEAGIQIVLQEAEFHHADLAPDLARLDDLADEAFWVFLNQPVIFEVALRFRLADEFPSRSWQTKGTCDG